MRKTRTLVLFGIAVSMGIGAAWIANNWILNRAVPTAHATAAATTPVVVAALKISFGQKIEGAHVKAIAMPNESVPKGVFNEPAEVEGMVATQALIPGEIVFQERVAEHIGGSTLAVMVTPKMRAVTVRVNDVIGVAGFLLPGNKVDVLASRKNRKQAVTRTLLQDIKVLAVDQKASPDKDEPVIVRAVTLEMSPKQAEKLVKARVEGSLQLTLRNPLDDEVIAPKKKKKKPRKRTVRVKVKPPPPLELPTVTVFRGTAVQETKVEF
ncbi:MAG: Flp pilus assembly protein CpaB [Acidiferrobacterales bacterium]